MASRSHGWFDDAKLLPAERMVRYGPARLRIPGPPYWWEGTLTLTSDRIFFIPLIDHPDLDVTAFWLCDLLTSTSDARNRFAVASADTKATFNLIGPKAGPAGIVSNQARTWLEAIDELRRDARPRSAFADQPRRRAAG